MSALLTGGQVARAQSAEHGFLDRVYIDPHNGERHRYVVFVPQGKPPADGWPVVLFLHGAGERGTDGRKQVRIGLGPAIERRADSFPAIIVFPQSDYAEGPILETWRSGEPGGQLARQILADVEQNYPVDPQRRSVTGWSMGGYGALSLAEADPDHWSKVLAVAGGGEQEWAPALARLPVWLVHGADDSVVPASESRAMLAALDGFDHQASLSDVPNAGHDLWSWVYDNDAVLDWLVAPSTDAPPASRLSPPEDHEPDPSQTSEERTFVPALVVSRAISLRLGNDALQTLVEGLPERLGDAGLQGMLDPIEDQVEYDGRSFDVRFDELSYQGRLHRAIVRGRGANELQLSFAVRDFKVSVGRIDVSDSQDGVIAGPVSVIIGHREPVWLDFVVSPRPSASGELKLDLKDAEFTIPDHNWYVKPPEQIDIQGSLFSPDVVSTAIVGGVYVRRAIIEEQILSAAPHILSEVERQVDFSTLSQLVTALWPLPVYTPRIEVLLEETSADPSGVSFVFGCAVEGLDGETSASRDISHAIASAPLASEVPKTPELQAGVSLEVIGHLSALVAGRDAARLYAADVPGRPFQELDDVAAVRAAADPAESAADDVRSQFLLVEPFSLRPMGNASEHHVSEGSQTVNIAIEVPHLSLTVFQKGIDEGDHQRSIAIAQGGWTRLAERDVSIRQPIRLTTETDPDGPTKLYIQWEADAEVRDRTDTHDNSSVQANQDSTLTGLFQQGWARWAANLREKEISVPDVAIGESLLRLDRLLWKGTHLTAAFRPGPTILVNDTDRSVAYQIRGPYSLWSQEFRIAPHRKHLYTSGHPLRIRRSGSASSFGQPLSLGTYDWSPTADSSGFHWVRRALPASEQGTTTATSVNHPDDTLTKEAKPSGGPRLSDRSGDGLE